MSDDCGILALGTFVRTGRNAGRRQPVDFTADELHAVLTHDDPGEMDCHYRLVRVRGRVQRAELTADGRTEFELEIGGHRLRARLESAAASLVEALVDRTLASVTGVLKVSFENNVNTGRSVTIQSLTLLMRDAILNLQSDEMMMRPPKDLLKILAAKANAAGGARVRTMLRGLPSDMSTAEKTDLIVFAQEAMTNAVKHGRAARILLVSDPLRGGGFAFSVLNDGEPFDAGAALGLETGHFGLSGMRERAACNGYALSFGQRNGWNAVRIERKKR